MNKKIIRLLLLICGIGLMWACKRSPEFVVTGIVAGADGQTVYLENVGLSAIELMDSVNLNASGQFTFKKARPEYPEFYRLRLDNQLINFAIDSTETISLVADAGTFATSYTVEGSDNCVAIKEITLAQLDANQEIRRLRRDHETALISDSAYQQQLHQAVENYKTTALKYIYTQPLSTASYFALFQQIDGLLLFNLYDRNDSRAFAAVATSYTNYYPENPRSLHLYNLAMQSLKVIRSERLIDLDEITTNEVDFLEIELPDISGEKIKLSDIAQGKVVILNFTAYQSDFSLELNQLLDHIYARHHENGLEIYQISLDSDLHIWRNVINSLPWVCVYDPQSLYAESAALYNVRELPTLFVLDRQGILVKRIEDLNTLETDVQTLLGIGRSS